ncbi:MAG: TonB-dependent receptor [Candidatus Korobacteraceae bacterium]
MFRIRVLLASLLLCAAAQAADLTIIVQSPMGDRVSGVQVSLFRASDSAGVAVQTTGGDGHVTFQHLADGEYRAVILAPGFAQQSEQFTFPATGLLNVKLRLATTPQTVVVSATATPATVEQSATSVDFLSSDQLTLLNPVSAGDALSYMPGAIVNTAGQRGGLASLFVRGGESNYNKVIIDGVPVNDPGGIFDFGVVPVDNLERVEMVRGPESTIYGSDAMTSTVQMWTATGDTRTPEIQFGADGGNFSTANGYASISGARGIFDYNVFADQFTTQGQGVNDAYSNALQGGNIGIRLSDNVGFRFRLRHSNNFTGVPSDWWFNGNPVLPPDSDQRAHQNNFLASAALTINGPGSWQHQITGFEYNHLGTNTDTYADPGRPYDSPFYNDARYNRAGFSYQGTWSPRSWALTTIGNTFEDENGNILSTTPAPDASYSFTHGLRINNYLFGQENIIWKRFTALAGLAWVHNASFGNRAVPRVSGSLQIWNGNRTFSGTRLRAAYAQGIKEPSFEQSFGSGGTFPVLPNPNLKPEENYAVEAGFDQSLFSSRMSLTAVYFHNSFRNQIEYQFNDIDFTSQYVNINRSFAQGAEVELRGQIINRLLLTAAYTYTSTQITNAPPCDPASGCDPRIYGAGAPLLRRPKQAGTVLLTYSKPKWGASAGVVAVGRRPDSDFLFGYIPPIYYAAGYARVDLGGWYSFTRHVTTYANLNNAFNNHYNEVLGYPALGINVRAGMRFTFGGE